MAHVNADLAQNLRRWEATGEDINGAVADGKRKGFVECRGSQLVISSKGREFLTKWTTPRGKA